MISFKQMELSRIRLIETLTNMRQNHSESDLDQNSFLLEKGAKHSLI